MLTFRPDVAHVADDHPETIGLEGLVNTRGVESLDVVVSCSLVTNAILVQGSGPTEPPSTPMLENHSYAFDRTQQHGRQTHSSFTLRLPFLPTLVRFRVFVP